MKSGIHKNGRKKKNKKTKKSCKTRYQQKTKKGILQANHVAVGITGDMEPGAGINQGRVPALQHICWIKEPASQSMQRVSWNQNQKEGKKTIL